jgi:hypothetical protein
VLMGGTPCTSFSSEKAVRKKQLLGDCAGRALSIR